MRFFKLSGAGNDFIGFDNRDGRLVAERERPAWFQRLCARGVGVGADAVLVLEACGEADVRMRYHNADGGETEMCGNGLRCLARLAHHLGAAPRQMTVRSGAGLHRAEIVDDESVRVTITDPCDIRRDLALEVEGEIFHTTHANTGVPHLALDAAAWPTPLDKIDVEGLGRRLRHHPAVMPAGANVNFFLLDSTGAIRMRTYERGVEAETLACGTGAVGCSVAAALIHDLTSPVTVITRSGQQLTIHFRREGDHFTDIRLEGPAVITYEGDLAPALLP